MNLQTIVMSRGFKKILEWQQILSIPSSENIVKYIKIELFMVVFCNLVYLGQYSYPSFEKLSTPTRKYR